jgi:septal ring factor EnvC (AmiA/AmiB activator)
MKSENFRIKFVFAAWIIFCFFATATTADAQKKKRKTNQNTQPVVSSAPAQTLPVIISRAEDIPSENQPVVVQVPALQEPPTETVDDKIDASNKRIKELNTRIKTLESNQKNEYDEKQKRLLLNLDILSRAEQRAESLRKQLFEIIEKESTVNSRLDQLKYDSRSENIERSAAFAGSLRPEELRDQRKKSLEAERKNLEALLAQIQNNRAVLQQSVDKADLLVEKVRTRMEKDIDDALADEKPNP